MKAKIEWYQEVLELEPGSKVFFPLARLLVQTRRADEAVRVLRQGLARHPEYIEARLLLVQLLRESGERGQCSGELDDIAAIFSAYPGFWAAWGEHAANEGAACALSFLAAAFRTPDLSPREVFAAALRGLDGVEPGPRSAPSPRKGPRSVPEPVASARIPDTLPDTIPDTVPGAAPDIPAAPRAEKHAELERDEHEEKAETENDEPSLRTRSMAEILADQGDIQGAVDIYGEILARAIPGDETDKLRARLAELTARLGPEDMAAQTGTEADAAPAGQAAAPAHPMQDMLEKLARRLDARAQT